MKKKFSLVISLISIISTLLVTPSVLANENNTSRESIYASNYDGNYSKYTNGDWINRIIDKLKADISFDDEDIDVLGDYDVKIYPKGNKTNDEELNKELFKIKIFTPTMDIRVSIEKPDNKEQLFDYGVKLIQILDPEIEMTDELQSKLEDIIYLEKSETIGDLNVGYSNHENTGHESLTIVRDLSEEIEAGEIEDLATTQPGEEPEYDEIILNARKALYELGETASKINASKTDIYADYLENEGGYEVVPYRYIVRDPDGYKDEKLKVEGELVEILRYTDVSVFLLNVDSNNHQDLFATVIDNEEFNDMPERPIKGDLFELYGIGLGFDLFDEHGELPVLYVTHIRNDSGN